MFHLMGKQCYINMILEKTDRKFRTPDLYEIAMIPNLIFIETYEVNL
ncbi:MAG: hypothetical protein HW421_4162 [Ignavibacteria bacterium]|nr:hypothetical protein [Ignavibacteria bacterium]